MLRPLLLALRNYPRRAPVTFGYLCLLLLTHLLVEQVLPSARAAALLQYVSTNLHNLGDHPVAALLGSALFFDGTLTDVLSLGFVGTTITLGLGIGWCLARLETRRGARTAFGAFLTGHVVATLLTAGVIQLALRHGWYSPDVRHTLDYGISYGSQTVMALATATLPRRARLPWAAFVLLWPFGGLDWSGPLPDFTTVGHLFAALLGFALILVPSADRSSGD
ncbi:rhomboid-like protein [Kitasatospora sp. LaBMicrA B282]|uniref:rhomboid-like protein n=1 Tax=Kitasatospora sp. LaBMicrA B282 TaxID=3420949 RepID=UPI003D0CA54D